MNDRMKLLIWGTGNIADKLLEDGINAEVTGFVESARQKETFRGLPVYSVDDIPVEYDYLVVASSYTNPIYDLCMSYGFDMEKIIFLFPRKETTNHMHRDILYGILGEKSYTEYCVRFGILKNTFFERDLRIYEKLNSRESFAVDKENLYPIIREKYARAGTVNNYFWQDLWAAKIIYKSGIKSHFDIGSRIDGFIAHLLSMDIHVTLIDVRDFPEKVEGLRTVTDDATYLRMVPENSVASMSALCSLEHFGLGRYGDPVDPEACFQCFEEIQKRLISGGNLYISVPIGRERTEFNAHRVFYPSTIIDCFSGMNLKEFSCTAGGKIEFDVDIHKYDNDEHSGDYRYGLFHFIKI